MVLFLLCLPAVAFVRMYSARAINKRGFREVPLGLHVDGKVGQLRMKGITVALLSLIEHRSRLTPAQLEAKFGLGLQGEHDQETGQEWKRYCHLPAVSGKNNQALSLSRVLAIAGLALDLGYVTKGDLWTLIGLDELEPAQVLQARLANERAAFRIFQKGKTLLAEGKMPIPPGGSKGGKPRGPRSSAEALDSYRLWLDALRSLGGEVFEDRDGPDVCDRDAWLSYETGADVEQRVLTDEDYEFLDECERPFDPRCPHAAALHRLHIRFSFGWVDQPWAPEHRPQSNHRRDAVEPLPTTDAEIALFFQGLESQIAQLASAAPYGMGKPALSLRSGAKAVQRTWQATENSGRRGNPKLL
ncbi:hypothetical protein ABWH74_002805 [Burkholderia vietnamiensis]|uniref:hypothetical protein n=1 Tax=Burkholderia vietnamiensis TaxID=60552 RepID=UPI00158DAAF5|nr:hypothetical protein [Burkholderia vietnamiensis]MBR8284634.1 hypothetical protein [Burkholderia vietnamiensis]MCA8195710.1 hypothetical protein [Burkholderia vietnamiensis]MDN7412323.1 hypothetical protein [Burkholderia vietnamiensis]MDN8113018.1 hypothetical protein [Burkholderia vietnamiensis]QTK83705.1 hypothetical protein J4D21_09930 [Burkholderia vietnamiensis]